MKVNKYLPVQIIHFLLLLAGIALQLVTIICYFEQGMVLNHISTIINIVALGAGVAYTVLGYKKNAAVFYKIFMWLYAISAVITYTSMIINPAGDSATLAVVLTKFISLGLIVLLAGAKDYGVVKSNIISIALLALWTYELISCVIFVDKFSELNMFVPILFNAIGQFVLASTAALMVCGKYIDKKARGAK